jgi:hypothetical protein
VLDAIEVAVPDEAPAEDVEDAAAADDNVGLAPLVGAINDLLLAEAMVAMVVVVVVVTPADKVLEGVAVNAPDTLLFCAMVADSETPALGTPVPVDPGVKEEVELVWGYGADLEPDPVRGAGELVGLPVPG